MRLLCILLCMCCVSMNLDAASSKSKYRDAHKAVKAAIKAGKKQPKWFRGTKVHWDMKKPWKEGRLEIRRLLAFNEDVKNHEAIKILYLYRQKGWDVVKGEWGEYPFLAGMQDMALAHYVEEIPKLTKYEPTHARMCLATLYKSYGAYDMAMKTLTEAELKVQKKDSSKFKIMRLANLNEHMGDVALLMDNTDQAKTYFKKAADLFPTSNQPYGREKLKPSADRCMRKIDRIDIKDLANAKLRDGTYNAQQQAYSGVLKLQVQIKGNKIAGCKVTSHKEKIHQGSIDTVPASIMDKQTVEVDAVLGATVTSDAIKDCTFQCLKQAGL